MYILNDISGNENLNWCEAWYILIQSWTSAKAHQCFAVGSVTFKISCYETIRVRNSGLPLKTHWQLLLCGALKADFSESVNICLGLVSAFPKMVVTYRARLPCWAYLAIIVVDVHSWQLSDPLAWMSALGWHEAGIISPFLTASISR